MNRFSEPKDWDNNVFRIFGTYTPDIPLALIPENRIACLRPLDDFNNAAYWPEFDLEMLKGSEPEILKVNLYSINPEGCSRIVVKNAPGLEEMAAEWLRETHEEWTAMKKWLDEYGDREFVKEREAA